jgi:hypothetical protein
MKKKQEERPDNAGKNEGNPLVAGIVKVFFEVVKHFINDFELNRSAKKYDSFGERFDKIDDLLTKMDNTVQQYKSEIEDLKNKILWSNILIIVLVVVLVIQLVR